MNHPETELSGVVKELVLAKTIQAQHKTIETYFAPDAGFNHPLCSIPRGRGSIEKIKGVYEWYKDMSPKIDIDIDSVVYDHENNVGYMEIVQVFHIFISLFAPAPAKLLVRVKLEKRLLDSKYYIIQQDDHYQPEDIASLVLPFLAPLVIGIKNFAGRLCGFNAVAFGALRNAIHMCMTAIGAWIKREDSKNHYDNGITMNGRVD